MKAKLIFVLILLFSACNQNTPQNIYGKEKKINIVDKHKYLETQLRAHDNMDVIVYRVDPNSKTYMNYGYAIVIFQQEKSKVSHRFDFMVASEDIYDEALYKWENDTTLRMKLYNSMNNFSSEVTQILRKNGGLLKSEPYN